MVAFILNNKTIVTNKNTGMTLLDFVRYEQRLTGTKIGCREGDCGACTVLVGDLNSNNTMAYQSITSCLSPLGNAHGKHIVTIEGTNLNNKLSPQQLAMKDNYATQCGFCTPGFVVALTGFALSSSEKTYTDSLDAISGNICRCTGYKSIENAAKDLCKKLVAVKNIDTLIDEGYIPEYFKMIPNRIKKLKAENLHQASTSFVAGGTDIYVQKADDLIDNSVNLISNNDELKGIKIENNNCTIGAGNTVSDLWKHNELNYYFPKLKKFLKLVSSEQIRNMATLGGNFVNASPIGDMTIFFLALNSEIIIVNQDGNERTLPLKSFYQDYKTFDLNEGELIKSITFKLPTRSSHFNFEKVSKRTHLDIATVNSALQLSLQDHVISNAHVSLGGVAAIPKFLHNTSSFLNGKNISLQVIIKANELLQSEISPISDVRGSSDYKRLLARQLFFAHFIEMFPEQINLKKLVQHA